MLTLGMAAQDKVTKFTGILVGRSQWLTGCDQYLISPEAKDGNEIKDGNWFDEGRIVVTGPGITEEEVQSDKPGGPKQDSPKGRY